MTRFGTVSKVLLYLFIYLFIKLDCFAPVHNRRYKGRLTFVLLLYCSFIIIIIIIIIINNNIVVVVVVVIIIIFIVVNQFKSGITTLKSLLPAEVRFFNWNSTDLEVIQAKLDDILLSQDSSSRCLDKIFMLK